MDHLLLSRPPTPAPAHTVAAGGDLLELDVLWLATATGSSPRGLGLLAALPEDEGGKRKSKRAGVARSAAAPGPGMARSAPVRIPSEAQRGRWAQAGGGEEPALPPHEIVARRAAAHSSVLEGAGRTLKGRDLRRVRNAVLRRTGLLH
jgi:hypothetical protein